jgi:hypothetical protein
MFLIPPFCHLAFLTLGDRTQIPELVIQEAPILMRQSDLPIPVPQSPTQISVTHEVMTLIR